MATLSERIAGERRRLRQVRQCMTAATRQKSAGNPAWIPLYIAIGDYFEAAMHRLHEQDIRMGVMLEKKVDLTQPDNKKAMQELDERLAGNQRHLAKLLAARDALRAGSQSGVAEFEAAGSAYAEYIVTNMGHHPGSTNLAQQAFAPEDWEHMAYVSEDDQAHEAKLFDKVFAAVPADLELPEAG